MNALRRYAVAGAVALVAVGLGCASVAFACSTTTVQITSGSASGTVGSQYQVSGEAFGSSQYGPVEIRWNSITGNQLASAPGPSFSVPVTIPKVAPGLYYIVAVQHALADNSVAGKSTVPYRVVASPPEPTPAPAPAPSGDPTLTAASPSLDPTPAPAVASSPSAPSAAVSAPTSPSASSSPPAPAQSTAPSSPVPSRATAASPAQPARSASPLRPSSAASTVAAVTPVTTTNDATVVPPSVEAVTGPAPAPRAGFSGLEVPPQNAHGSSSAVGAAMLSLGAIAAMASFWVALLRRRRVVAAGRSEHV